MKATVDTTDPVHKTIKVELPWSMVSKELEAAYKELSKDVSIKGFRKGKVPRNILRQRFGKRVEGEVVNRIVSESYEAALIQHKVQPVSRPELTLGKLTQGQPYEYTARVEVRPEIKLVNYRIPIEQEQPETKPEMLEEELTRLREAKAVMVPIEGRTEARSGDAAIIDYQANHEGQAVNGGEMQNHTVLLGSGKSVPGFDEQVVGMNVGESKKFDLTYPSDWGPGKLAGKAVSFNIRLNALKSRDVPELTDEFVKDLGRENCENLETLKAELQQEIVEKEKTRVAREARTRLTDELIKENPFMVPPSQVDHQQELLAQEVEFFLAQQGMSPEQAGLSRDRMKKDMRERAERDVRAALLLNEIGRAEKIEVGDSEMEEHMQKMAQGSGQNLQKIKALYDEPAKRDELKFRIRQDKVLDYLLEVSNIENKGATEDTQSPGTTGEDK
jgi:trigger factor